MFTDDRRQRSRSRSRERDASTGAVQQSAYSRPGNLPPALPYGGGMGALGSIPNLPPLPAFAAATNAHLAAQEKINRELFVGNTPPGTSEMLLLQFLNGALRRVKICGPQETPILNCRVNTKFAFVELVNSEMANKALNLNGIPFLGAVLKVSRPSKYAGPHVPAQTWQQLTGQSLPVGTVLDAEQEKINRELFVGNTTPEM